MRCYSLLPVLMVVLASIDASNQLLFYNHEKIRKKVNYKIISNNFKHFVTIYTDKYIHLQVNDDLWVIPARYKLALLTP